MSTINLLPDDYLASRQRRRANILITSLCLAVMVGIAGAYVVTAQNYRNTLQVQKQVDSAYEEAARMIEQMQQLKREKARLMAKADQVSGLQERVPRSYLLAVLTNACPQYTSLTNVDIRLKKIEQKRPTGGKNAKFDAAAKSRALAPPTYVIEIRVRGLAATDVEVAQFIAALARQPLLASVDLAFSREKYVTMGDSQPSREFEITCKVRKGVDVLDYMKHPADGEAAAKGDKTASGEPRDGGSDQGGAS